MSGSAALVGSGREGEQRSPPGRARERTRQQQPCAQARRGSEQQPRPYPAAQPPVIERRKTSALFAHSFPEDFPRPSRSPAPHLMKKRLVCGMLAPMSSTVCVGFSTSSWMALMMEPGWRVRDSG